MAVEQQSVTRVRDVGPVTDGIHVYLTQAVFDGLVQVD